MIRDIMKERNAENDKNTFCMPRQYWGNIWEKYEKRLKTVVLQGFFKMSKWNLGHFWDTCNKEFSVI